MSHGPSMHHTEAMRLLKEGHERFLKGEMVHNNHIGKDRREELHGGQAPYATIITCADSRVPPEHIFDGGLGDLFIIRNAGNLITPVSLGSLEYAAAHTGCPVGVIMGHTSCGAVGATLSLAKNPDAFESTNVDMITRRILPAVLATESKRFQEDADWVNNAVHKNVLNMLKLAKRQSPLLTQMIEKGDFKLVGAIYSIQNNGITWIDDADL